MFVMEKCCLLIFAMIFKLYGAESLPVYSTFLSQNFSGIVGSWADSPYNYQNVLADNLPISTCEPYKKVESCRRFKRTQVEHEEANLRSLSPFRFCINESTERYPSKILQAQCLCRGCLYHDKSRDAEGISKEIAVYMKVVRFRSGTARVESCNERNCYLETIRVPIGCHCVTKHDILSAFV